MSTEDAFKLAAFFALAAFVLIRNLPGFLLFVRPAFTRYRVDGMASDLAVAAHGVAVRDMLAELTGLGFTLLGAGAETRPLRADRPEIVLASAAEASYAVVRPVADEAWLHYLTPFEDGGLILSADHPWAANDEPSYQSGGLPGSTPAQLLNAHRRRVARFLEAGRTPTPLSLEGRGQALERFYAGTHGRRETRRREVRAAVLAAAALGMVGMLLNKLIQR